METSRSGRRWSWRWLFDSYTSLGGAATTFGLVMSCVVAGLLLVTIPLTAFDPRPLRQSDLFFPFLLLNVLAGQALGVLSALDRIQRGKPTSSQPPLRPAWWYRRLTHVAMALLVVNLVVAVLLLLVPRHDEAWLGALRALTWLLFTANVGYHVVLGRRVTPWVEAGAELPGPAR